jgi:hypothetical protein
MALASSNPAPVLTPASLSPKTNILKKVPFISQNPYRELCWAACGAMVLSYKKKVNVSLADAVSTTLGSSCTPATCNFAEELDLVYTKNKFVCDNKPITLGRQGVRDLIDAEQPVQVYWQWNNGGDGTPGHTVLIVGYRADGHQLVYNSLEQGGDWLSFGNVCDANGEGTWQATLSNFFPR